MRVFRSILRFPARPSYKLRSDHGIPRDHKKYLVSYLCIFSRTAFVPRHVSIIIFHPKRWGSGSLGFDDARMERVEVARAWHFSHVSSRIQYRFPLRLYALESAKG